MTETLTKTLREEWPSSHSEFFERFGLAFVMAASYFGSGSVFIMSSAGVQFGYALVWLVALAILLGIIAQDMSARVGIFGDSLGQFTRRKLGKTGSTALLAFISVGCVLWGLELTAAVGLGTQILLESVLGVSVSWMVLAGVTAFLAAGIGILRYQYIEYLMTAMMLALFVVFGVVASPISSYSYFLTQEQANRSFVDATRTGHMDKLLQRRGVPIRNSRCGHPTYRTTPRGHRYERMGVGVQALRSPRTGRASDINAYALPDLA